MVAKEYDCKCVPEKWKSESAGVYRCSGRCKQKSLPWGTTDTAAWCMTFGSGYNATSCFPWYCRLPSEQGWAAFWGVCGSVVESGTSETSLSSRSDLAWWPEAQLLSTRWAVNRFKLTRVRLWIYQVESSKLTDVLIVSVACLAELLAIHYLFGSTTQEYQYALFYWIFPCAGSRTSLPLDSPDRSRVTFQRDEPWPALPAEAPSQNPWPFPTCCKWH